MRRYLLIYNQRFQGAIEVLQSSFNKKVIDSLIEAVFEFKFVVSVVGLDDVEHMILGMIK